MAVTVINNDLMVELSPLRQAIVDAYRSNETQMVNALLQKAELPEHTLLQIQELARKWVISVRKQRLSKGGLDAFLAQYDLSSVEGIALMCLAEGLLRIPDAETRDRLIRDKIQGGKWEQHVGKSTSMFVNAATWALMLTGRVISREENNSKNLNSVLKRWVQQSGEPIIREAVSQAMKILGKQFVMGQDIEQALKRAIKNEKKGYVYSYDMLGEAACTWPDADLYYESYRQAITAIGSQSEGRGAVRGPGISVKLSALHPRYEWVNRKRVIAELLPRLKSLVSMAKEYNMGFTIDAEEADRLDLSLDLIGALVSDPSLRGWDGFGFAVQAYQKRGLSVIRWAIDLARKHQQKLMIRLVKGAYWDSEIKWAQERGLNGYPVFTRKLATDVSYIACVKELLAATDCIYPQFATHNAYTASLVKVLAEGRPFEFQCLHGMGDTLYSQIVGAENENIPCRIYAPVGVHEHLLAYLVRRLLENGANTSFVNRIVDENAPVEDLIANPCALLKAISQKPHPQIPLPAYLYGDERPNSKGVDPTHVSEMSHLLPALEQTCQKSWQTEPTGGTDEPPLFRNMQDPSDHSRCIGRVSNATSKQVERALQAADQAFVRWSQTSCEERAECLEKMAKLLEDVHRVELWALLIREGGKTFSDAVAELREAVDFCWYYARRCREDFHPETLAGPTGEQNQIGLHGRGVIACISPWNFPLAIFIGQVTAALAAGNTVIAKPASQTCLIARKAVELLYEAGIPRNVLHLMPGDGRTVGNQLIEDARIKGVMFTGSTETARMINQKLANRPGPIVPFVAETGGLNCMIVDSSALPEQVARDVLISAFGSAGQRCSALRVLFVQSNVADRMLKMITGAMAELKVGDPLDLSTDVGPVIDRNALNGLLSHKQRMSEQGKLLYEVPMDSALKEKGSYCAPCVYEIDHINTLGEEVFGPILHVIRYEASQLDQVIESINGTGYGLTLGVHSRIYEETVDYIARRVRVGNVYVNRSMIGAVVGVQPFGGEGLSGTGPKAGGPRYLHRLATERTLSINTAAAGGNASLMALMD